MSKTKKTATPAPPKPDIVVLCDKCPGNLRIKLDHHHGDPYMPNFTCGVCNRSFAPEATRMLADAPETNAALKEREPKIVEFRLNQALKTIEAKDRDILLLKERVDSYERAMQFMGGSVHLGPFGMRRY
jgi:hypothetical protein